MARTILLAAICLFGAAATMFAQTETSAIVGVVKDSAGALVPGANVEVTSPALLAARTTVTGGNGQYRITDLRPGEYTVTISKTGFQTVVRQGVTLTSAFTATVDVQIPVGQQQTLVTVTAAAPLVDLQNSLSQSVLTRNLLETIPSGKDIFASGQTLPGVTTQTSDVGGTTITQQPTLQIHGSNNQDNAFVVDGMMIQQVGFGGNQTGFYYNDGLMQEVTYQTNTLPAEDPYGGVQINMVPRDGGNQFHGDVFATGANSAMQSSNSNADLRLLGVKAINHTDYVEDVNASVGGPVLKNRLWFFSTFRRWAAYEYLLNTFEPNGQQALNDTRLTDYTLRFAWQVSKRNKLTASYDRNWKWRGHRPNNYISSSFSEPIATVVQNYPLAYEGQIKWTSVVTNRLLIDAGYTSFPDDWNLNFQPGVTPNDIAIEDINTSTFMVASPRADSYKAWNQTYVGNVSYVTGSHNFKTGIEDRTGFDQESFVMNGDMVGFWASGVPTSVELFNLPLTTRADLNTELGYYVQDSWRLTPRVTINPGIRFEHLTMGLPAQSAPGGVWVGPRSYTAKSDLVDWNTWSPRFGVAWDMFGDGKTVLKGGVSKYDRLEPTNIVSNVNPNFISFEKCPWSAPPGTLVPQNSQINFAKCTPFSQNNVGINPNLKRPYQWEYTAMVQRQISRSTEISAGYYGRHFYDLFGFVNTALPPSAYTPVTITNPLTGKPLTVYAQNSSTLTQTSRLFTTLPFLEQHYNGVEFQINTQLSKFTAYGGFTVGKDYGTPDGDSTSLDFNNPNSLINLAGNFGYDSTYQIRGGFVYRAPWGIQLSGSLREGSGLPQSRTYQVTQKIVPNLTQVTQSVLVAPPGAFRYPWTNLFDFRFSKVMKLKERVTFEPLVDVYNVFNSSAVTSEVTTIGTSLGKPSAIVDGRLLRLGGRITF